jgi:hypothetical protein
LEKCETHAAGRKSRESSTASWTFTLSGVSSNELVIYPRGDWNLFLGNDDSPAEVGTTVCSRLKVSSAIRVQSMANIIKELLWRPYQHIL